MGDAQLSGALTNEFGAPLADIAVTRYSVTDGVAAPDGAPVVTSSRGFFYMEVPAGTYRVCFHDLAGDYYDECWENEKSVDQATDIVLAGSQVAQADALLTRVGRGSIVGHVSASPGSPAGVANVGVALNGQTTYDGAFSWVEGGQATTDSNGSYRMESVPAGTYALYFAQSDGAYSFEYFEDAFHIADATLVVVRGGEETTVSSASVEPRPSVSGKVVNQAGRPLPGITVLTTQGAPSSTSTDASGQFSFKAIEGKALLCYYDSTGVYAKKCWKSARWVRDAVEFDVPHTGTLSGMGTTMSLARDVTARTTPRVRGRAVVGRTLRLTGGAFMPSQVTRTYQWLADGRVIKNATRPVFTVTSKQLGKKLRVRLTVRARDYNALRVTTAPTRRACACS